MEFYQEYNKENKMRSRSIKELLEVMLDHQDLFKTGLCGWAGALSMENNITFDEFELLDRYITNNRPKWYSSFSALKAKNTHYYWVSTHKAPRIRWIKKHIKK